MFKRTFFAALIVSMFTAFSAHAELTLLNDYKSIDFGYVAPGNTVRTYMTVSNQTAQTIQASSIEVSIPGNPDFSAQVFCPFADLRTGDTCHIEVTFSPTDESKHHRVVIVKESGKPIVVPVSGTSSTK